MSRLGWSWLTKGASGREVHTGALSGVHPKLSVKLVDGKFVAGIDSNQRLARYIACQGLAVQLINVANRKRPRYAQLPLREFLRRLRRGVVKKDWALDPQELDWVMRRVLHAMDTGADDLPGPELVPAVELHPQAPATPVETIVDRIRKELQLGRPVSRWTWPIRND